MVKLKNIITLFKKYIKLLALEINYNYDILYNLTIKIEDKYWKIKFINPIFEGVEYNECINDLSKLRKEPYFINKTFITI